MSTLEEFKSKKPDFEQFVKQYPELSDIVKGTIGFKLNDYTEKGYPIASWDFIQGKPKNSTHGLIDICNGVRILSSEGYTEIITILEGRLEAEVNDNPCLYERGGRKLIAPPNSKLKLNVKDKPILYFCQFLSDADFVRILREEFGWKVESPSYSKVPEPKSKYITERIYAANYLKRFLLEKYTLTDDFGKDSKARSAFRRELYGKRPEIQHWISNHSKLRGNELLGVIFNMAQIKDNLKKTHPRIYKRLNKLFTPDIYKPHGKVYNDDMETNEKIELAKKIDMAAYKFLEVLSK